jgi:hypothetical protein
MAGIEGIAEKESAMMFECRVRFNYPPHLLNQPIIFDLSKKFDLEIKILEANVTPQQGRLLLSIRGEEEVVEQGLAWVSEQGVIVELWAGLDGQKFGQPTSGAEAVRTDSSWRLLGVGGAKRASVVGA